MKDRLNNLLAKFPLLLSTAQKLNENDLIWMIGGSACLYLYGNERIPGDIDIYLPTLQHEIVNGIFGIESYVHRSPLENVKNSNPNGDHSIQLTSDLWITKDGNQYHIEPTSLVLDSRTIIEDQGEKFYIILAEEVLLIKVLLGRGADMGEQDIQDAKNFLKIYPKINSEYIQKRQKELALSPDFFSAIIN
jgi:hypothetical protein